MSAPALYPGSTFAGDYRIVRPLSQGGMGAVYVAVQGSTARERALKVMLGDLVGNEDLKRRFEQEARVGAQIDSEHIVEVVGAGVDAASGMPWLAMELLAGETLAEHLSARGALSVPETLEIFSELCHALGAAHDKQIVHRDLKPENVFLARTKRADGKFMVKVLDFGIAKLLDQARTSSTSAMGTPLWMAPEQTETRGRISPAADVWALGLLAFRALTGRPFWKAASAPDASSVAVLRELAFEPIPPASVRAKELQGNSLPAAFDAWFACCVDRDPGRRYPHARVAFESLRAALQAEPVGARQSAAATVIAAPTPAAFGGRAPEPGAFATSPATTSVPVLRAPPPTSRRKGSSSMGLWLGVGVVAAAAAITVGVVVATGKNEKDAEVATSKPTAPSVVASSAVSGVGPSSAPIPAASSAPTAQPAPEAPMSISKIISPNLTFRQIHDTLEPRFPDIKKCYADALASDPSLKGEVTVTFVVGFGGDMRELGVRGAGSDAFRECMKKAHASIKYPPPSSQGVSLESGVGIIWVLGSAASGAASSATNPSPPPAPRPVAPRPAPTPKRPPKYNATGI